MDKKSGFDIFGKKQVLDTQNYQNNPRSQNVFRRNFNQPIQQNNFERNQSDVITPNQNSFNPRYMKSESSMDENPMNQNIERIYQPKKNYIMQNQPIQGAVNPNQRLNQYQSEVGLNHQIPHPKNFPHKFKNFDNLLQDENNYEIPGENVKHHRGYGRGYCKPYGKQNKQFHNRDPIDIYLYNIENTEPNDMKQDRQMDTVNSVVPKKFKQRDPDIKNIQAKDESKGYRLHSGEKKIQNKSTENFNIVSNISDNQQVKPNKNIKLKKNKKRLQSMNEGEENQQNLNEDRNQIVVVPEKKNEEEISESTIKPKIKISLDKVNELEKKRKLLVKSLETTERERSISPVKLADGSKTEPTIKNNLLKQRQYLDEPKKLIHSNFAEGIEPNEKAKLMSKCSIKEMKDREEQNNLNILEIDPNTSFYDEQLKRYVMKINPEYAIKAFSRPAADTVMNDPENIRPPQIISKTIQYILNEIVDLDQDEEKQKKYAKYVLHSDEINYQDIALFVEDRLRAIRQDYTILNLKGNKNCIEDHEKIARFLIICLNECLDYSAFTGYQGLLKSIIQQLNATMTSLREFYEYVNERIKNTLEISNEECYVSPHQAEFYSYSILLSVKETSDLISMLNKIPYTIINTKYIRLTKKLVRIIIGKEWLSFFKILQSSECDYLMSCVMSLFFKDMRTTALEQISKSPYNKIKDSNYKISINKLCDIFLFEDSEECVNFLDWFGLDISQNMIYYPEEKIELIRTDSEKGEATLPKKTNRRFVEKKRKNLTRKDIISNGYMEKKMLKEKTPPNIVSVKKSISLFKNVLADGEIKNEVVPKPEDKYESKPITIPSIEIQQNKTNLKKDEEKVIIKDIFSDNRHSLFPAKKESFFNLPQITENKSIFTAPTMLNKPEEPPEVKATEDFTNDKYLLNLNEIEQQFRKDQGTAILNERSILQEKKQDSKETLNKRNEIIKTDADRTRVQENKTIKINSLLELEKKFKKLSFMRFFSFLKQAHTLSNYYEMKIKNFRYIKKMKIFKIIRRYAENIKLNRFYIRELILMKLDKITINGSLSLDSFKVDKNNFFNYFDIRNMLIHKFTEENKNKTNETLNHLKINIYTEKDLFYSTSILQNIFSLNSQEIEENKIEIEEGKNFLNISAMTIYEPNTKKYFSFFLNFTFLDQLELSEIPMFIKENLKALDKFSYGLIFLDYSNTEIIEKLMIILDYANAKSKKEFHLIKYYKINQLSSIKIDDITENIKDLKKIVNVKESNDDYLFFPKYEFTTYYSDMIEYHNNREFFKFFENEIKIQNFSLDIISLEEYFKRTKLFPILKKQDFRKNNFLLSTSGCFISESNWIRFFIDFETILNFSSSIKLLLKHIHNNFLINLKEILKVPIELYNPSELQRVEKLIQNEEILIYLYHKLRELDLISIFKEQIKNPNFCFEKFMMSPNINIILSQYLISLFNSFVAINNLFDLNIKEYRETLLNEFNILKSNYNINIGSLFKNLLKFVKKFFNLIKMEIPLKKDFKSYIDTLNFTSQVDLISSKTFSTIENLMRLFKSTGLSKYMERDFHLSNFHIRNLREIVCTRDDYLVVDNRKEKIMHLKMSHIKKLVEDSNSSIEEFLKKKRKGEDANEIEKTQKKRRSQIVMKKNYNIGVEKSKIIESKYLTFEPHKLCLVSK